MEYEKTLNSKKLTINEIKKIEPQKPKTIMEFINEDDIVIFISQDFNFIIAYNKQMKGRQKRSKHEYIHSSLTSIISLEGFLRLIIKYTVIEHNTLILSYLFIKKLIYKENFIPEKIILTLFSFIRIIKSIKTFSLNFL